MQTISILGAGWLGLPLGIHLRQLGYTVKGSTTTPEKLDQLEALGIEPYFLQVNDGLKGLMADDFFDCDVLFVNIPPSRRREDVATWYPRQIGLIAEKVKAAKVSNLIFISSTSVYGDVNQVVTENNQPRPDTDSAKGLLLAEKIIQELPGVQSTILRMSGLVGGDRKAGRFFAGKTDVPEGNAPINLVHLEDCIGVISAVIAQNCWGELFNVCADEHPIKAEFYRKQAEKQGFVPPTFLPDDTPRFKIVSNEKIKKALGYQFTFPDPMDFE
jgi:nucleoside-diphosphate-sugar epimerase